MSAEQLKGLEIPDIWSEVRLKNVPFMAAWSHNLLILADVALGGDGHPRSIMQEGSMEEKEKTLWTIVVKRDKDKKRSDNWKEILINTLTSNPSLDIEFIVDADELESHTEALRKATSFGGSTSFGNILEMAELLMKVVENPRYKEIYRPVEAICHYVQSRARLLSLFGGVTGEILAKELCSVYEHTLLEFFKRRGIQTLDELRSVSSQDLFKMCYKRRRVYRQLVDVLNLNDIKHSFDENPWEKK